MMLILQLLHKLLPLPLLQHQLLSSSVLKDPHHLAPQKIAILYWTIARKVVKPLKQMLHVWCKLFFISGYTCMLSQTLNRWYCCVTPPLDQFCSTGSALQTDITDDRMTCNNPPLFQCLQGKHVANMLTVQKISRFHVSLAFLLAGSCQALCFQWNDVETQIYKNTT